MAKKKTNWDEITEKVPTDDGEATRAETSDNNGSIRNDEPTESGGLKEKETAANSRTSQDPLKEAEDLLNSIGGFTDKLPPDEIPEIKKRGRKKKEKEPEQPDEAPPLIPGELAIEIIDHAGTTAFALLDRYISKRNPITPDMIALNEDQKKHFAPAAEKAVQHIMKKYDAENDPVKQLVYGLGVVYFSNYLLIKQVQKTYNVNIKNNAE